MQQSDFENIYDTYGSMLYSIALQICHKEKYTGQILINIFKKI